MNIDLGVGPCGGLGARDWRQQGTTHFRKTILEMPVYCLLHPPQGFLIADAHVISALKATPGLIVGFWMFS